MTDYDKPPELYRGLRLHQNEHTGGCSPRVLEALAALRPEQVSVYPPYQSATDACARHLGVADDMLVLVNGLDEGILAVALTHLRPDTHGVRDAILPEPAFEIFAVDSTLVGGRVVRVMPRPDFQFALDEVLAVITPETRVVFVTNPNNPTGIAAPLDAIRTIARRLPAGAVVFVDEAYVDFGGETFIPELASFRNVIVGRTFSKAFGLAGIRIGALVGHPDGAGRGAAGDPGLQREHRRGGGAAGGARRLRLRAGLPAPGGGIEADGLRGVRPARADLLDQRGELRAGPDRPRRASGGAGGGRTRHLPARSIEASRAAAAACGSPPEWWRTRAAASRSSRRCCAPRGDRPENDRDPDRPDARDRGTGPLPGEDRHPLPGSHAGAVHAARRIRPESPGHWRPRRRSAPHRRRRRHRARRGGVEGPGRPARHQPGRLLRDADGRDPGGGGDRSRRPVARRGRSEGAGGAGRRSAGRSW